MTSNERPRKMAFLKGISGMFRPAEADAEAKEPGYTASAEALEELLAELSEQAEEKRQAALKRQAVASGRVAGLDKEAKAEVLQKRLDETHARIRKDVLAMHERLRTGIDDQELEQLDERMGELCGIMAVTPAEGVEPRIRAMVARRFFDETGPMAWSRLVSLMDTAGIDWPAPNDDTREHDRLEAEEMFLHASPVVSCDLVTGVVSVWGAYYPQPDSLLRQRVCLRACGAGLRASMLRAGIEHVREHEAELKAKGESLLREKIATVQQALKSGLRTVEEADQVMAGTSGLLETVLPDLCWDRAREAVMMDR